MPSCLSVEMAQEVKSVNNNEAGCEIIPIVLIDLGPIS